MARAVGVDEATNDDLKAMLRPASADLLQLWPLDRWVGNVKNGDAELAVPIALQRNLSALRAGPQSGVFATVEEIAAAE